VRNRDVAEMLDRAARILSLRGENRYRVRAYKRAARAVASSPVEIEKLMRENKLQALEGVGAGIAVKIKEIVKTGKLSLLERVESGKLPEIEEGRMILLASALTLATELIPGLEVLSGVTKAALTGDVRRGKETVEKVEIVLAASDMFQAKVALENCEYLHHLRWDGNFCSAMHSFGLSLTLYLVQEDDFSLTLWVTSGSAGHIKKISEIVRNDKGQDLLCQEAGKHPFTPETEEAIYNLAGLPFIHPELREDRGEVEAAQEGRLPVLVEASDYCGDLHVHSNWSDGTAEIEEMVDAASELGYRFIAVTDHSRALKIAGGLSLEKLAEQGRYIQALQAKYPNIRIFAGIEADILDDGSVDAPDEVLAGLDVVIASVHSGFRQSSEKLTARICRAMHNPYVQIIAHATGRLLEKRQPYAVNMDEVIRTAAATGTALEINSSPDRLDINDIFTRQAKEAGVLISVNTDAHSQLELANAILGLTVARRGWLTKEDVLNTRNPDELISLLQAKRKSRYRGWSRRLCKSERAF